MTTIRRTYPQPDSPQGNLGARERALAVFKYLLNLEPEVAKDHPLFSCVVHAFEQHATKCYLEERGCCYGDLEPSLVPMLTSEREVELDLRHVEDPGL